MKQELIDLYHLPADKIIVVSGGQDVNDFPTISSGERLRLRRKLGFDDRHFIVLFAGRLSPVKGLDDLLTAMAELVKTDGRARLVIVGSSPIGRYDRLVQKRIRSLALQHHILMVGYAAPETMFRYFNAANAVVVPSTYEPFGMVTVQAAMQRKPLIATDCCGSLELLLDYPRLKIVSPHAPADLLIALRGTMAEPPETKPYHYRLRITSWDEMAKTLVYLFSSIMNRGDRQTRRTSGLKA